MNKVWNQVKQKKLKMQRGVTLVELLMGVFLFAVVMVSVALFFNYFFDSYYFAYDENLSLNEVRLSLDQLSSELRTMRTSEDGAYPMEVAGDYEISFYVDSDDDGRIELVRYEVSGGVLSRGIIEPGDPPQIYDPLDEEIRIISGHIVEDNPVFYYYDQNWPLDQVNNPLIPALRLLTTRMVGIKLKVNTGSSTDAGVELETKVMLRNLKSNY